MLPPAASPAAAAEQWTWTGADEFSRLGDRVDAPPLPLPLIASRRRVVLVRHGQSTWNAEGRIQGSSNFSSLTPKGVAQAQTTHDMVRAGAPARAQREVRLHSCLLPSVRVCTAAAAR